MKSRFFIIMSLFALFSGNLFAADSAFIISFNGSVTVQKAASGEWAQVSASQVLSEKDNMKTGTASSVDIGFYNGSVIRIAEDSKCSMEKLMLDSQSQVFQMTLKLNIGQVMAKVQKFKNKNSSFELRTPSAVTAIRGTEFIVNVDNNGETKVAVFEGQVGVANYAPSGEVNQNEVPVGENQESAVKSDGTSPSAPGEMSPEMAGQADKINDISEKSDKLSQELESKEKGEGESGGNKEEDKKKDKESKNKGEEEKQEEAKSDKNTTQAESDTGEYGDSSSDESQQNDGFSGEVMADLRQEMQEFVGEVKVDISEKQEIVDEVQQSDFAEGKSIMDVHGNLVRIMQYLQRPDKKTVQFLNLIKRDAYNYNAAVTDNFLPYEGATTARLDSLETKAEFNKEIPEAVADWPAYFQGEDAEGLEMVASEVVMSNMQNEIHMISKTGGSEAAAVEGEGGGGMSIPEMYIVEKAEGKVVAGSERYIGKAKDLSDDEMLIKGNEIGEDTLKNAINVWGGVNVGLFTEKPPEIGGDGVVPGNYYEHHDKNTDLMFAGIGINNNGNVIGLSSFSEDLIKDPTKLLDSLKGVAGEVIITSRHFDSDYKKNIDLVVPPDSFVSIAEELLPALTDLIQQ